MQVCTTNVTEPALDGNQSNIVLLYNRVSNDSRTCTHFVWATKGRNGSGFPTLFLAQTQNYAESCTQHCSEFVNRSTMEVMIPGAVESFFSIAIVFTRLVEFVVSAKDAEAVAGFNYTCGCGSSSRCDQNYRSLFLNDSEMQWVYNSDLSTFNGMLKDKENSNDSNASKKFEVNIKVCLLRAKFPYTHLTHTIHTGTSHTPYTHGHLTHWHLTLPTHTIHTWTSHTLAPNIHTWIPHTLAPNIHTHTHTQVQFPTSTNDVRLPYFPKTPVTANSSTMDILIQNFGYNLTSNVTNSDTKFASRLALETFIVHGPNTANGSIQSVRTIDDEYTPSVFSTNTYMLPGNQSLEGFLQWKPISYQDSDRRSTASQQVNVFYTSEYSVCESNTVPSGLASKLFKDGQWSNVTRWFLVIGTPGDDTWFNSEFITW